MPQGPRLNLTQLSTLRELVRRGTWWPPPSTSTPPGAASQHLALLEAALGVALVERSTAAVLTDGRVMAEHAEELSRQRHAATAARSAHDAVAGPGVGTWGSTAATLCSHRARMSCRVSRRPHQLTRGGPGRGHHERGRHEVDVAFGLDYLDAPMPATLRSIRAAPAGGASRGRGRRRLDPRSAHVTGLGPGLRRDRAGSAASIGSCRRRPRGTAVPSAPVSRRLGVEPNVVHEVTDTAASCSLPPPVSEPP